MSQGKLISFVPLMKNNVHDSYTGQNGTMYKFTITVDENGKQIVGTGNSTKTTPSWKVGEQYLYEVVVNGQYTNFKGFKSVDAQSGGGFGAKAPNPEFGIQKAFECALECTFKFFELNPDIYNQVAEDAVLNKMWLFMLEGSESRRWINMSAMRLSLLKLQANGNFDMVAGGKISDWLFTKAKDIANSMEAAVKAQVETDKANKAAQPPQ